jgi:hypothetical protein
MKTTNTNSIYTKERECNPFKYEIYNKDTEEVYLSGYTNILSIEGVRKNKHDEIYRSCHETRYPSSKPNKKLALLGLAVKFKENLWIRKVL